MCRIAKVDCSAEEVKNDGFIIQTVGDSIFIVGGEDKGVLYGIYELLHHLIDFECFGVDNYTIRKNAANVPLLDFDIKEVPDYTIRTAGYGSLDGSNDTKNRLRLQIANKKEDTP